MAAAPSLLSAVSFILTFTICARQKCRCCSFFEVPAACQMQLQLDNSSFSSFSAGREAPQAEMPSTFPSQPRSAVDPSSLRQWTAHFLYSQQRGSAGWYTTRFVTAAVKASWSRRSLTLDFPATHWKSEHANYYCWWQKMFDPVGRPGLFCCALLAMQKLASNGCDCVVAKCSEHRIPQRTERMCSRQFQTDGRR